MMFLWKLRTDLLDNVWKAFSLYKKNENGDHQVFRYSPWPTSILYMDTVPRTTREDHQIAEKNLPHIINILLILARCTKWRRLPGNQVLNLSNQDTLYRYSHLHNTRRSPYSREKKSCLHNPNSVISACCAIGRRLSITQKSDQPLYSIPIQSPVQHAKITI